MSFKLAVFLGTAVLLPLLLSEFSDWCPWLAVRLVRWAARRLGNPRVCARYEEEWVANLEAVPGKLARLATAASLALAVPRMRATIRVDHSNDAPSALELTDSTWRVDPALRNASGLDRALASLERSHGARGTPVRPVRFGRR
jgi:hypothetical protein